jgi:glycosyltransferase involved in cell wall biosynthesis
MLRRREEDSDCVKTQASGPIVSRRLAPARVMTSGDLPQRILFVHADYRQRGGEEAVVEAESALLRSNGHTIEELRFDNAAWANSGGPVARLRQGLETVWSSRARRRVRRTVEAFRPDLVHVHNTFPSASPAIYSALPRDVPVVQTLHNYRLVCPAGTLFRAGGPCTDCLGRAVPWPGIKHACYRGSMSGSAVVATMLATHRMLRTWSRVDAFVALNPRMRDLMISGGLPGDRIRTVPNFLEPDPGARSGARAGFLYAGRLTEEKGIRTLIEAARARPRLVRVAGDGPLAAVVAEAAAEGAIEYLGHRDRATLVEDIRSATALVVPSLWFEPYPMVFLEAFASGTPVIASRIGAIPDIVTDGETGLLVDPGDGEALARAMGWALDNPKRMLEMGKRARGVYEARFRGPAHLEALLDTYRFAAARRR